VHNLGTEGVWEFLKDNWVKLRSDELTQLIITYVYNYSPLAVETKIEIKIRGIKTIQEVKARIMQRHN